MATDDVQRVVSRGTRGLSEDPGHRGVVSVIFHCDDSSVCNDMHVAL